MRSNNESSTTHLEKSRTIGPAASVPTDEEDSTLQHESPSGAPQMFSWALAKDAQGPGSSKGSVLRLLAVAAVAVVLASLGLLALTRSASRMDSVTAAQAIPPNVQSNPSQSAGQATKGEALKEPTVQRSSPAYSEDNELKNLRERRIGATASDRSAILQAFASAEKQYPNDYRFPYERAKLALSGSLSSSHDEAFDALSLAAEKAINTGKAHEMLDVLETDKDGDFHKLSRGHHEWRELVETLKKKDSSLLSAKAQF